MKYLLSLSLLLVASSSYGILLSGSAATAVTNLSTGDSSFVIVDTDGDGLDFSATSVGTSFAVGSSIGDDYIVAFNPVTTVFGTTLPGEANFNLGDGSTASGDSFYIIAFSTQSTNSFTVSSGDKYGILSHANWVLPSNNSGTFSYGSDFNQFSNVDGAAFTVVPEPSTYAMFAGALALGYVMIRRRR